LIRQHKAWFTGLMNLPAALRVRYAHEPPADRRRLAAFVARRMAATVSWGLRGGAIAVLVGVGFASGWPAFAVVAGCVAIFGGAPLWCVSRFSELSTASPDGRAAPRATSAGWLLASIPALFVDGLGFWPAVVFRLRAGAARAVPAKTAREPTVRGHMLERPTKERP
jgi:hypothetical protein